MGCWFHIPVSFFRGAQVVYVDGGMHPLLQATSFTAVSQLPCLQYGGWGLSLLTFLTELCEDPQS